MSTSRHSICRWIHLSVCSLLILSTLFLRVSFAETPPGQANNSRHRQQPKNRRSSDDGLNSIVDLADAVPPEYEADVLIRLAQSGKITSREKKLTWLRKAFNLAADAQLSVQPTPTPYSDTDTKSGYLAVAAHLHLDTLSLESRVVSAMLPIDSAGARELLEQIQFPTLQALGCEEPLTYDLSMFYQLLEEVENHGFTEKERLQGKDVTMLVPYLTSLQSHAQVQPIAQLLRNLKMSSSDLGRLVSLFADAISRLRGDPRSFAAERLGFLGYQFPESFVLLIKKLDAQHVPTSALLTAFREYLTNNLNAVQCGETADQEKSGEPLPGCVLLFNEQLSQQIRDDELSPINKEELRNSRVGPRATVLPFWSSVESKRLMEDLRKLRFGNGKRELSEMERATTQWNSRLIDFLTELEAWKPSDDDEIGFFDQKCILYSTLIQIIPNGAQATKAIDDFVDFLELNSVQRHSPSEWIFWVDRLLSGLRAPKDRQELIQAFANSGDSTLNLYARLELWDPRHLQ